MRSTLIVYLLFAHIAESCLTNKATDCAAYDTHLPAEEISNRLARLNMQFGAKSEEEVSGMTEIQIDILENPVTINCLGYDAGSMLPVLEFQCDILYPKISMKFHDMVLALPILNIMYIRRGDPFEIVQRNLRATVRYKRVLKTSLMRYDNMTILKTVRTSIHLDAITPAEPSSYLASKLNQIITAEKLFWKANCLRAYGALQRRAFNRLPNAGCLVTQQDIWEKL